jgi:hypothetical protein
VTPSPMATARLSLQKSQMKMVTTAPRRLPKIG